jgi:hypothetical protein
MEIGGVAGILAPNANLRSRSMPIYITTLSTYYNDEARRRLMPCPPANTHGNGLITES